MARTVKEIMTELSDLNLSIQKILYHTEFEDYDDLSGLDIDYTSAEELYLMDELRGILDKLSDVSRNLKYLERPIKSEGVLHKNSNGRYEFNGIELSSGYPLEYLATDDRHMRYDDNDNYIVTPYWAYGRIEHNGNDYYIFGASKGLELEGLKVRIRR